MKNILSTIFKIVPSLLLISFVALKHFQIASWQDTLIVVALCALQGFRSYLDSKQLPDIRAEVAKAFIERDKVINKLEKNMSTVNISKVKESDPTFRF